MATSKPVPAPRRKLLQNQVVSPPPLPPKAKSSNGDFENLVFAAERANLKSGRLSINSTENDSDDSNKNVISPSSRTKNVQKENSHLPPLPPRPRLSKNKTRAEEPSILVQKSENQLEFESEEDYIADVIETLNYFDRVVLENARCELDDLNPPPLPPKPKYNAEFQAKLHFANKASISTKTYPNKRSYDSTLESKRNKSVDGERNDIEKPIPALRRIQTKSQSNLSVATEQSNSKKNKAVGFLNDSFLFTKSKSNSTDFRDCSLSNNSSDSDEERGVKTMSKSTLENKTPEQVSLTKVLDNDWLLGSSMAPPKVHSIIKEFLEEERDYVNRLEEILELSAAFQMNGLPDAIYQKFFGLLNNIYNFHKETLHWDLEISNKNPATLASCFVRHASNFHIYIERQLLIPQKSDLSEFEDLIIRDKNLEPYINVTKGRVAEYIKKLLYLKQSCNKDDQKFIGEALKVVENLYYQLEMVQKLRDIEDIDQRFRECGQVHLDHSFKVSVNGNKRRILLVYLCENLIIFATLQENKIYRYVDDIPTIKCYCCTAKPKSSVFEIGIKGKKRFTLKAESQAVKERWCEGLKRVLQASQFEEV